MKRLRPALPLALAVVAALLAAATALGHGGDAALEVEPSTIEAGGSVMLVGENLEPDEERILILKGPDLTLALDPAMTDEEGMFAIQIAIPAHLPAGVYEFQAIGDETLTVTLNITGGPTTGGGVPPEDPGPRARSVLEVAAYTLVGAIAFGVGAFLVIRAERLAGGQSVSSR